MEELNLNELQNINGGYRLTRKNIKDIHDFCVGFIEGFKRSR